MPEQPQSFDFPAHFLENYNTQLSPENEQRFQNWLSVITTRAKRNVGADLQDYDLRGYWLNGGYNDTSGQGHMTDQYKKPNHPTFSKESMYSGTMSPWGVPFEGGSWSEKGDTYTPSAIMLQYTHPKDFLQKYMSDVEPDVILQWPKKSISAAKKPAPFAQ